MTKTSIGRCCALLRRGMEGHKKGVGSKCSDEIDDMPKTTISYL